MGLPFSPLIDLLNSFICAFCSYRLYRSYQSDPAKSPVLLYFSRGYFAAIIAYLLFSLPRLIVPDNSLMLGIGFLIAQASLYVSVAFFAQVATFFINAQWVRRVFWLVITLAAIAVVLNIVYFGYPQYDRITGVTEWNIHDVVGIASIIVLAGVLVPSCIFFFWQGYRSRDSIVKTRSIIIATGLLLLVVTTYTYYSAATFLAVIISDLFSLLSFLVIFLGIIYKREKLPRHLQNS